MYVNLQRAVTSYPNASIYSTELSNSDRQMYIINGPSTVCVLMMQQFPRGVHGGCQFYIPLKCVCGVCGSTLHKL